MEISGIISVYLQRQIPMAAKMMFRNILLICLCMTSSAYAGAINGFNFPPGNSIQVWGDAFISNGAIQLNMMSQSSLGWATYSNLIPLQALTSFSSHFQFSMAQAVNESGDGLTFFLAPSYLQSSDGDHGEWLGLFRSETDGNSSNQILAVEFDTYEDDFDPDDNHVGIDVNGVKSQKTVSVRDLFGDTALNNGEMWDAWVEYYGPLSQLQVFLLQNPGGVSSLSRPGMPVLWYDIDLSQFLPPAVRVGFSASTGIESSETHTVHSWSFSCSETLTLTPESLIRSKKKHSNVAVIVIVLLIVVTLLGFVLVKWRRRGGVGVKKKGKTPRRAIAAAGRDPESGEDDELDRRFAREIQPAKKFSYTELCAATKNFSEEEKIGEGGFGKVYRGNLPGTNRAVAVKRMDKKPNQDGQKVYESEVTINGRLTHRNLVVFLGWCHTNGEKLLVYELLPNGSLDKYIFENNQNCSPLDWEKRYMVARDIAAALVYLHQDRRESVLHRDIKAENVMLDSEFRAKLGDFGLARALKCEEDDDEDGLCESAAQYGTFGFVAPEVARERKFTRKSDVFSFGALALLIACGRRPVDNSLGEHGSRLVEWVWHLHEEESLLDAADEKLHGNFNGRGMERLLLVGLWCSHPDPKERPSMEQVLDMLKRGDHELPSVSSQYPRTSPPSFPSFSSGMSGGFSSRVNASQLL